MIEKIFKLLLSNGTYVLKKALVEPLKDKVKLNEKKHHQQTHFPMARMVNYISIAEMNDLSGIGVLKIWTFKVILLV